MDNDWYHWVKYFFELTESCFISDTHYLPDYQKKALGKKIKKIKRGTG